MLSFEELQSKASAEKQLLSYEEFQNQVLKVFNASKRECDFTSSRMVSLQKLVTLNASGYILRLDT